MLIFSFVLLLVAGCSSDDKASQGQPNSSSNKTEDTNISSEESSEKESVSHDSTAEGEVLRLGETGTVESTIGEYEITVESFEFVDEVEGESSLMELFVLVDVSVTNTGDQTLLGEDINSAALFNQEGITQENTLYYESIELLKGEMAPGESMQGQLLFHQSSSDYYDMVFNYGLETVSTELTWRFDAEEASNASEWGY